MTPYECEVECWIACAYRGWTVAMIARATGRSQPMIVRHLVERGAPVLRGRPGRPRGSTRIRDRVVELLRTTRMSDHQIAVQVGCSSKTVRCHRMRMLDRVSRWRTAA